VAEPPGVAPRQFRVMGVLNVTPDSFSDGGCFLSADAALEHGARLASEGADIIDVGGESTRPGAEPVGEQEELARVLPVVERLADVHQGVCISIDTQKASVARAALEAGARFINDVSALRGDPEMAAVVAQSSAECCLMHMLGDPRTMQRAPRYRDVVDEVKAFLHERLAHAVRAGVREERLLIDPGIGFGKTLEHNLELLRRLPELLELGRPVVIGTSRKSFLGRIAAGIHGLDEPPAPSARLAATLASNLLAFERGASVFRVHDVAPAREALAVAAATLGSRWTPRSSQATPTS
jgi:dihydropteroate synthase